MQHPVTPLIIGFVIALDGPDSLAVRSACLYGLTSWLCLDIRPLFSREKFGLWRHLLFSGFCSALTLGTFAVCFWLISQSFERELSSARRGITAVALRSPDQPVFESHFTVINGSEQEIGRHSIQCGVNLIADDYGEHFMFQFSIQPMYFEGAMEPNGDRQTVDCLRVFKAPQDVDCLDIFLRIN